MARWLPLLLISFFFSQPRALCAAQPVPVPSPVSHGCLSNVVDGTKKRGLGVEEGGGHAGERERERESVCVCVFVCITMLIERERMCVCVCVYA